MAKCDRPRVHSQQNQTNYGKRSRNIDKNIIKDLAKDPSKLRNWDKQKRIHPKFRTRNTANHVKELIEQSEESFKVLNLPKDTPARKSMSQEEKLLKNRQRKQINTLKEEFFKPVKAEIIVEYGEPIANYMISNRRVAEIVVGKTHLLPYQIELIKKAAKKQGLSIPSIVN